VPEKKSTVAKKTTVRKGAAAGDVASGRAPRPRRPTAKAGKAAASSEGRLPSTSPAAARSRRDAAGNGEVTKTTKRREKVGKVVSAKTPFTVIVEIERLREHPLYKKVIRVRRRVPTHDAKSEAKAGDIVRIQESKPFSATKRWQVIEVISRAGEGYAAAPDEADIERELEAAEGVTELLARPERKVAVPAATAEGTEDQDEDAEDEK
jgi:small subunit ribosomal protein S17